MALKSTRRRKPNSKYPELTNEESAWALDSVARKLML